MVREGVKILLRQLVNMSLVGNKQVSLKFANMHLHKSVQLKNVDMAVKTLFTLLTT